MDPISMAIPMILPAATSLTIHNVTTRTLRKLGDFFGIGDKGGRVRRRRKRRLPPRDKKGRFRKRRRRRKKR